MCWPNGSAALVAEGTVKMSLGELVVGGALLAGSGVNGGRPGSLVAGLKLAALPGGVKLAAFSGGRLEASAGAGRAGTAGSGSREAEPRLKLGDDSGTGGEKDPAGLEGSALLVECIVRIAAAFMGEGSKPPGGWLDTGLGEVGLP